MTPAYYGFKGAKFGGTFKATVTDRQLQLVDAESQDSLVRRETSPWGRGTCAERSGDLGTLVVPRWQVGKALLSPISTLRSAQHHN